MNAEYPYDAQTVADTLTDVYRHQGKTEIVSLLESSSPEVRYENYDNWNGGQHYYTLHLRIPRKQFALVEARLETLQKSITEKLATVFQKTEPHYLNGVVITPQVVAKRGDPSTATPSDAVARIWGNGKLCVFLSHISKHKEEVTALKVCLRVYGISAFVAHEDVEPTREWQREIEIALNTMHVLAAILTPGFENSLWADQEVGYALGRGTKTVPIKAGALPHGFLGKLQAMSGELTKAPALAKGLALLILRDTDLRPRMQDALLDALAISDCWADTKAIVKLLVTCSQFSKGHVEAIANALKNNTQVSGAFGAAETLKAIVKKYTPAKPNDDDLPF